MGTSHLFNFDRTQSKATIADVIVRRVGLCQGENQYTTVIDRLSRFYVNRI